MAPIPGLRSSAITPPLLPSPSHWRSLRTRGNNFSLFHSNKMILVFGWKIDIGLTWSATITGSYLKSLLMRIIRSRAFIQGLLDKVHFSLKFLEWLQSVITRHTRLQFAMSLKTPEISDPMQQQQQECGILLKLCHSSAVCMNVQAVSMSPCCHHCSVCSVNTPLCRPHPGPHSTDLSGAGSQSASAEHLSRCLHSPPGC